MITFIGLYRGNNIRDAKMIEVSIDPELVHIVAHEMLRSIKQREKTLDPILYGLNRGRTKALRAVCNCEVHRT